jgi:hypothetical protein
MSNSAGGDHHIWNNNGTYWCHYTVHLPDYTKRRVRVSLQTRDPDEARRRRDLLLGAVPGIAARIPPRPSHLRPGKRPAGAAAPAQPRSLPRPEAVPA